MSITKTLRLQAFLLLAFLGSVQATVPVTPLLTAEQQNGPVTDISLNCGKGLNFTCIPVQRAPLGEFVKFQKDGKDIESPDASLSTWEAVTPARTGPQRVGVLSTSRMDVSYYGAYTCLSATTKEGTIKSLASNDFKITCKGCSTNTSCEAHDEHSYCNTETERECACKYNPEETYGDCKACNKATNAGCTEEGKPRCNPDTYKCEVCSANIKDILKFNSGCKVGEICQDGKCKVVTTTTVSSAGTVTATASVVIASVLVSLMN